MVPGSDIVEATRFCDKSLSIVVVDFIPGVDLERRELDFTGDGVLGAIICSDPESLGGL